jgi:metal-sulfur cluster biosynthetic enzyme
MSEPQAEGVTQASTTPENEQEAVETAAELSRPQADGTPDATPAQEAAEGTAEKTAASGPMPSEEQIREALKDVIDPEIGINIVDLGLIYDVLPNEETRQVEVNMTLTSPGCPVGPELKSSVWLTVKRMEGVDDCEVNLVWKPRWDPSVHASEEAQMFLGIW